jgi:hypothetical protein
MNQPLEVLGAMVTPVVLISAAALLLLSTAHRVARVNDRLRELIHEFEQLSAQGRLFMVSNHKHQFHCHQLAHLEERLQLLRGAACAMYVTIALLVLTSIVAGMYVLFPQLPKIVPMSLGMSGAVGFLYSILLLVLESSIASRVTSQEIAYARQLLEQQDANQPCGQVGREPSHCLVSAGRDGG